MTDWIELDPAYSTTRRVRKVEPEVVDAELKAAHKPEDQFETILFQPEGEARKGEGGLRTQGYFKKNSEEKPLITVITVVFNGEKHLEETILSIINQNYENVEYIIIDGGSTDGTLGIVRKYENAIDYWFSEKDKGIYDAMNKAIKSSMGSWVYFLNSNDRLINESIISIIVPYLVHSEYMLHFNCEVLDSEGNKVPVRRYPDFPKCLQQWPCVQHQSVFCNIAMIKHIGLFSVEYKLLSDYDFFVRAITQDYSISVHPEIKIAMYNSEGISAQKSSVLTIMREARTIQLMHFNRINLVLQLQLTIKFILTHFFGGGKIIMFIRRLIFVER